MVIETTFSQLMDADDDRRRIGKTCIDASIMLLQGIKINLSNETLRVRMKEIGEKLIRVAEDR